MMAWREGLSTSFEEDEGLEGVGGGGVSTSLAGEEGLAATLEDGGCTVLLSSSLVAGELNEMLLAELAAGETVEGGVVSKQLLLRLLGAFRFCTWGE
jgi:hypothetical protein